MKWMKWQTLMAFGVMADLTLGSTAFASRTTVTPRATLIAVDMLSAQQGWAMNMAGQILQTRNGGRRWTIVSSQGLTRALNRAARAGTFSLRPAPGGDMVGTNGGSSFVAFPNERTAWIMVPMGMTDALQVWHTGDAGRRWTVTTLGHVGLSGGLGQIQVSAVGNRDAWVVATSGALAGHVAIRVWRTNRHHPAWHPVFQGNVSGTTGLAFVTGGIGVLTGGTNMAYGPHSASLRVTANGGHTWSRPRSPLPLPSGHRWVTTVLAPAIVPGTRDVRVPVLMQPPVPPKTAPLKTWWQLEASTNGGQTWTALPATPDPLLKQPPAVILQAWTTPQVGWVILGSRMYRTHDGGTRWSLSTLPAGTIVSFSRVAPNEGFVLVQRGTSTELYRTQDGGLRWFRVHETVGG